MRYSATARYTITTGGNVCLRYLKIKTNQFICLKEKKKKERERKKKKKPRQLCNNLKANQSHRKPDKLLHHCDVTELRIFS
mgnify:CR=1 FL=1